MATLADRVRAKVRAELAERGVSQAELARYLERPAMWVSDRLRGAVMLTVDDLDAIAEALDMDALTFLERAGRDEAPRRARGETKTSRPASPLTFRQVASRPAERRPAARPISPRSAIRTARIM
jgi:transcriptional regulator with XRE-family HTH domain